MAENCAQTASPAEGEIYLRRMPGKAKLAEKSGDGGSVYESICL